MSQRYDWNQERESKLRKLWDSGISASGIAKAFDNQVTRNAIVGKAHRMGLVARKPCSRIGTPAAPATVSAATVKCRGTRQTLRFGRDRVEEILPPSDLPPPAPCPDGVAGGVPFDQLNARHCRFEVSGSTRAADYRFCGADRDAGSSYCAAHRAVTIDHAATRRAHDKTKRAASHARRMGVA